MLRIEILLKFFYYLFIASADKSDKPTLIQILVLFICMTYLQEPSRNSKTLLISYWGLNHVIIF